MLDSLEAQKTAHWRGFFPYIQVFFYLGEGYSLGTLLLIVPLYVTRVFGVSYTETGAVTAFAGIPWLIKIFFGLLTDKVPIGRFGRRKPYLLLSAIISIPFWWYFTTLDAYNTVFLLTIFIISSMAALSDTVLDGYIIDITPEDKNQIMQSAAWGGRGFGRIAGTIISLSFVNIGNYIITFQFAAVIFVITTLSALLLPSFDVKIEYSLKAGLKRIFSIKGTNLLLLVSLILGAGIFMDTFASLFLEQYGFDDENIRNVKTVYDMGYVLGAVLAGVIYEKLEITSEKLLKLIFLTTAIWLPLGSITQNLYYMYFFFFVLGTLSTAAVAVLAKISMQFSPVEVSSTMFALFMSMQNFGTLVVSSILSGYILDNFPPIIIFVVSSAWNILALLALTRFTKVIEK